ncbi:MAG TPA: hypothetical protein VKZ53_16210 [Candidatus Angelobacter sp.]|nr:hypothetical protein [Candidatus Angelobacter sp.]
MSLLGRRALILLIASLAAVLGCFAVRSYRTLTSAPAPATVGIRIDRLAGPQFHTVLSTTEKEHVLDGQFTIVTSTQALPEPIQQAFAVITREPRFLLADPGQRYQVTDVILDPGLPFRRLVFAGVSGGKWFLHYEQGGIGHSYKVVVLSLQSEGQVEFLWGGLGFDQAKNLEDLRRLIAGNQFSDDTAYRW